MSRRHDRLAAVTGGEATLPLAILFGLNFVDEFDRIAFAALTPEIRDAFGLSDTAIGAIGVITGVFVLLAALPMGIVADRANRVHLSAAAALLWGTMSVLTGIVAATAALVVVRLLAGIGRVANEVVHPSLLTDYYTPRRHPRVFLLHRLANPLSAVAGLAAGAIAEVLGWRWAFALLAVPTFVLLGSVAALREPGRGESTDATPVTESLPRRATPFPEARRQLFAVRTLRRLWLGSFLLGVGALSISQFVSLYFENVHGFGPFWRGFVQFVFGAGALVGLFAGERLASRAVEAGHWPRLATVTGMSFVAGAAGLLLMSAAPWAPVAVALAFVLAAGFAAYQPAYFPLVGMVAPARLRAQAYAWSVVFVGLGGVVSIYLFGLGDAHGYRIAIAILSLVIAAAGGVGASAARFVAADIAQARRALAAPRESDAGVDGRRPPLLSCTEVEVAYGQVQVLFGATMTVNSGEIVALLGTNGAGKSTLLRAISGAIEPMGGVIHFDGHDITHAGPQQAVRLGIIQVPGGKAVFPTLTVAEHLRAAGWLYRSDARYLSSAIEEVYGTFPRLRERQHQLAGNLSGGEQQMLALGMAFIAKPRLLMIDELSLGLAPAIVEQLLDIVRRIQRAGTAIVLVEQSINVALTVADRAYFLEKGQVRFEGRTADLVERRDLVRAVFLPGSARAAPPIDEVTSRAVEAGNGDSVLVADALNDVPAVALDEISVSFGGVQALAGVSFSVSRGEAVGLIGPNGAGKTTILDVVSGFVAADAGRVLLGGTDITRLPSEQRARMGLGRSFQDARLFPSLTVTETLALSIERFLEHRSALASFLALPAVARQEDDVAWTVSDLVELMGLGAYRDKFIRELSTGTRRVVDLAMCIAHDPQVLLLDEPSSGIAQREAEALGPLLQRLRTETGCSLIVVEHDMPLISSISDRMVALELGQPIADGPPQHVLADPRVVSAYLGGDAATINRSGTPGRRSPRRREPLRAATRSLGIPGRKQ